MPNIVTISTREGTFSGYLVSSGQFAMTLAIPEETCPDSAKKLMHKYSNGYCVFSFPVQAELCLL